MLRPLLFAALALGPACAFAQMAPGAQPGGTPPGAPAPAAGYPQAQAGPVAMPADPASPIMMSAAMPPSFAPGTGTPPPQQPVGPVRISGGVMAGNRLTDVAPVYPPEAKETHLQGTVVLAALISESGAVESLKVISGPPSLAAAATEAVRQWTYRPYVLNGEPTEVMTTITVNFRLGS